PKSSAPPGPGSAPAAAGLAKTTPANSLDAVDRAEVVIQDAKNNLIYQNVLRNLKQANTVKLQPLEISPESSTATAQVTVRGRDGAVLARSEINLNEPEYLTHLMTDRPMYRPGEIVRFRSLTLERFSLKPAEEELHLIYRIIGPNQQEIFKLEGTSTLVSEGSQRRPINGPDGKPLRGIGAGEWLVPLDLAAGQYTISVSEGQNRFPTERRTFLVGQWQQPRLNKELNFHRSSYGPGETVEIEASAKRVEGGAPLADQKVVVTATVDGRVVYHHSGLRTNAQGTVRVLFKLPPAGEMPSGLGTIAIQFEDGAGPETVVRPIPIVLNRLQVEFFPEGGDLVQGVANRVYVQVRNTLGRPARLKGRIVDQSGAVVAHVETLHDDHEEGINQGQGAFTFTPLAGKSYQLAIDSPQGIQGKHPLPTAKSEGVVLHLTQPLANPSIEGEVVSVDKRRMLMIGAYCRGRLIEQERVVAFPGRRTPFTLRTAPGVSGVYRVTVFEIITNADGSLTFVPCAERLTYRPQTQKLDVALRGIKDVYAPGERVVAKLLAKDEKQQPAAAVALVRVVDLSVLKLADDKTDRAMPTHFLLTTEIRQPEDFETAD
ncbi:MAG: hypothetical protein NZO58_14490, partial [Gemmataceae bacterium]|nr:hypothetical protein [Gemmataceae bacterium]